MNKRKTKLLGLLFSAGVVQLLTANMLEDNIKAEAMATIMTEANWQQSITGTVMDEEGIPLSGASILVKGTTNGVVADFDGKFKIEVAPGSILVISYVGFETKEITLGVEKELKIVLTAGNALEEVVITALGIKKEKKRIGYATQEVKGVTLQKAITPNVLESLSGKVAGLTVISNGADFFSDPSIFLRGEKPILVVDGVPQPNTDFWNISSDDIESINVLKGAAASALYGSLGKFGALQITMKSGKGIDGTRVSINSSTTFQTGFLRIPKAQTQYGPGNTGRYEFGTGAAGGGGINDFDYSIWGPKFDGRLIKQSDSPIDPVTGERIPTPWISRGPDNLGNFVETGLVTSNNVTLQSGSEKGNYVISNSYKHAKGSIPGQKLDINTLRLTGTLNVSDAISVDASLQYNYQYSDNRIRGSYGPTSPIYLLSIWGGANFDVRNLEHVWVPGKEGIKQDFVENWRYNNPYALAYNWKKPWTKNDILTYAKVNFKITDKINAFVRSTLSTYSLTDNEEISKDIYNYDIPDRGGRFRYNAYRYFENNTDFLITYNDSFFNKDVSLEATLGGNQRYLNRQEEHASTTQLIVPEVFTLQNSVDQVTPTSYKYSQGVYSAYAVMDFSYRNRIFFGMTGRVDKSSTLPEANDTFFYPSVYSSIVLSDLIKLPSAINYLKLRTAYAQVGGDLGIYEATNSYSTGRYRNLPTANFPSTLENPDLRPSFTNSFEYGFEMKVLNSRLGIDFSYYENQNGPQIFTQPFSAASAYEGVLLNGRTTERRGMDFSVTAIPVRTKNFNWSAIINFDKSKNYLTSLPPLPDGTIPEWEGDFGANFRNKVGTPIGDYFYYVWERSPDGQLIIYENGLPKRTDFKVNTGNTQPDFISSINNSFSYKNLSMNFLFDGRFGGVTQDAYERDLWRAGGHPDAIHPERELSNIAYVNGGDAKTMQIEGVRIVSGEATYDPDGNILTDTRVFEPSEYKVDYQSWASRYKADWPSVIKDKTFIKLREVVLTYNVGKKLLDRTFMDSASLSVIGRNLWYWTKDDYYGDLDTYTLTQGDTGLQLPSQRSIGFNLNVSF
ncbi:SusC/RagA family TonB-linked outer membrane protein [Arenibacter troitsensis]|uniref:TonB-linked outer membrane protein, SusC/RagA family n=1 Tax=Arenibacter troitsensis TaxID=188872 RepID=A0A1X7HUV4_9FLAO|nr:SusC/RagA family TonB-linked outer membrane protein [Arenibacter troitsensis]SMG05776.1 TonB-linked outer membrane protein, SusC/RagA family [Arenibacter troitsensis]